MRRSSTFSRLPEPVQVLLKLVGIPLLCMIPLFLAALYFLGGTDLLQFTLSQLTWKVSRKILWGVALLAAVTWIRHEFWYQNEPPPMWWRRSIWLNLLEIFVLLGLILLGIWAMLKFAR